MDKSVEKIEVGGVAVAVGDVIVAKGIRLNNGSYGAPIEYKIKVEKIRETVALGYYVRGKAGDIGVYLSEENGKVCGIRIGKENKALADINEVVVL